ncbi:MAG TPA: Dabb family protein [Pirellulales bacterium]|nr:Dabb family protein [Pirellulales bacterium]
MLAHTVYFTLHEPTPENRRNLVESCHKHLSCHPGTVFYAAGTPADLDRPVNVRDWDVGLHVIFLDRAAHDAYQVAPAHLKFVEENKPSWKQVRVFDSDVSGAARSKEA